MVKRSRYEPCACVYIISYEQSYGKGIGVDLGIPGSLTTSIACYNLLGVVYRQLEIRRDISA